MTRLRREEIHASFIIRIADFLSLQDRLVTDRKGTAQTMDRLARHIALLIGAAFLGYGPAYAASDPVPPPSFPDDTVPAPTLKRKPASHFHLGTFDVVLEKTPLSRVRQTVGAGSIEHQGDAAGSIYWLCYTIASGPEWQRVWMSSGELGGAEHSITTIAAAKIDAGSPIPASCPVLPSRFQSLSLGNGVWLGLSREDLIRRVGVPSRTAGHIIEFWYEGKTKLKYSEPGTRDEHWVDFDVLNGVRAQLEHGRVIRLWASGATTS